MPKLYLYVPDSDGVAGSPARHTGATTPMIAKFACAMVTKQRRDKTHGAEDLPGFFSVKKPGSRSGSFKPVRESRRRQLRSRSGKSASCEVRLSPSTSRMNAGMCALAICELRLIWSSVATLTTLGSLRIWTIGVIRLASTEQSRVLVDGLRRR